MFYGYDLGMDMISSTAAPTTTATTPAATTTPVATTPGNDVETTTTKSLESTPEIKDTTTATVMMETTTTTTTTTIIPTIIMTTTTTEAPTTITTMTVEPATTITSASSDTTDTNGETTDETTTTTTQTETDTTTDTPAPEETTAEMTTISPATAESANDAAELISSFVAEAISEPLARIQQARVTRLPSAKLQAPPRISKQPQANYLPSQRKSKRLSTNRNRRHLIGLNDFDSQHLFVGLFHSDPYLHSLAPITGLNSQQQQASYLQVSNEFEVDTDPNYINSSPTADIKQNYNTDVITHVFYLSPQQVIYTTFKVYNAVLYYKYFDHLRMTVLELELDTPEYNLIILLPDYNTDMVAAASSLRSGPKLRLMRKQLKPKWVQAIIPDFKLHGTMFLTNDLQNVSICAWTFIREGMSYLFMINYMKNK